MTHTLLALACVIQVVADKADQVTEAPQGPIILRLNFDPYDTYAQRLCKAWERDFGDWTQRVNPQALASLSADQQYEMEQIVEERNREAQRLSRLVKIVVTQDTRLPSPAWMEGSYGTWRLFPKDNPCVPGMWLRFTDWLNRDYHYDTDVANYYKHWKKVDTTTYFTHWEAVDQWVHSKEGLEFVRKHVDPYFVDDPYLDISILGDSTLQVWSHSFHQSKVVYTKIVEDLRPPAVAHGRPPYKPKNPLLTPWRE